MSEEYQKSLSVNNSLQTQSNHILELKDATIMDMLEHNVIEEL